MDLLINPLLLLTVFPLVGVFILLFLPKEQKTALRWIAISASILAFIASLWMLSRFKLGEAGMQLEYSLPWLQIGQTAINFHLGVDGLSVLMVLLTTLLTPLAILSTWKAIEDRVKGFMIAFLLLETGMLGVFLSLDLVLFYICWEFTLVPMYFLIGIWGGERRIYAAVKFFLFTMAGSVLMLLAIFVLGFQAGTFSWVELVANRQAFAPYQLWLFLAFALAFAIKVPMWPLHTWLPDAHVEAPTAGSVILAAVLLKMGVYGFLRFNLPLFPEMTVKAAPYMAGLAIIGILYGAAVAYVQKDVKKLVAYSSVSHLGFVVLGIFALTGQSLAGAVLQMVNHGISTGALFLIVGMLYERRHTRLLDAFGGLWKSMPVLGWFALIVVLSSMGLPALNGFVGEFNILAGAFSSPIYHSPWFAGLAALGVILSAVYLLHMFEKVFLGPLTLPENRTLKDISWREILTLLPLVILIFWIGLYPKFFFDLINPTLTQLADLVQAAAWIH